MKFFNGQNNVNQLLDAIPHMVWVGDAEGKTLYINRRWKEWVGVSIADLDAGVMRKLVHADDIAYMTKAIFPLIRDGVEYSFRFRLLGPDGGYRWFVEHGVPILDEQEKIKRWVTTSTNIDDIVKAEEQKDEFMSVVAHELRTPLTSAKAFAQILHNSLDTIDSEQAGHLVTKIDSQLTKLGSLVTDLLDRVKLETGRMEFACTDCNIDELLEDIVDEVEHTTRTHELIIQGNAGCTVWCDSDRTRQVFINLLTNAIKYSPKADKVIVDLTSSDDCVTVSIQDFGIGIDSEAKSRVFEKFYRATKNLSETYPGLGLGLYISREIVVRQGGSIDVVSTPGKGSVFRVRLPRKSVTSQN